ncbi:MAG TPA: type IV pilus modification protein PilV [Stenotrophomonas sp.]|jgi:type IV pilus assembly protein PilV
MNPIKRFRAPVPRGQGGFTLIEVMIAVLVLGIGLLGFALLQTMSVRFAQSANYRTQATNLSYELLDRVRINRVYSQAYVGNYTAATNMSDCDSPTGGSLTAAKYMTDWSCRMGKALGENATANVARNGDVITVQISWNDDRWVDGAADTQFSASTRL